MAKLVVHRKAYTRKAYTRRGYRRKNGTYVKPAEVKATKVPATTYKITDRGAKGRGKKIVKIKHKGRMTKTAKEIGVLDGKRIKDLSMTQLKRLADRLVKKYGAKSAKGMVQAQVLFRKRTGGEFYKKMKALRDYIGDKYGKLLTPRKAIQKWKSMSPTARAKAMPERKGRKGYKLIKGRWHKVK